MKPIERILAAIDHSDLSKEVLKASCSLAQKFKAKVTALNVVSQTPFEGHFFSPMSAQVLAQVEAQAQKKTEEVLEGCRSENVEIQAQVSTGTPYVEILKWSKQNKASFTVIATHGRKGWERLFLGSVAESIIRKSDCPVWTLKAAFVEPKKILVPIDLSESSRSALPLALFLAKAYGAALHLLCVFEPVILPDYMMIDYTEFELKMKETLKEEFSKFVQELNNSNIPISSEFLEGDPRVQIAEVQKAQACDLILMSTQGKSFIAHKLLGSVTASVAREVPCSLITVRPEGFKLKEIA